MHTSRFKLSFFIGSLMFSNFVITCYCSIFFFLIICFVVFYYRSYWTFFLHKICFIISIGDLPTTNIIEPKIPCLIRHGILWYDGHV
ncbi:hypothetical protein AZK29_01865 [Streptococcus pneumoniae]|nr:hypothetical protein AZK29_01865 [Streptococcus pneumoniae]